MLRSASMVMLLLMCVAEYVVFKIQKKFKYRSFILNVCIGGGAQDREERSEKTLSCFKIRVAPDTDLAGYPAK